jgi:hypothetical protein
MSGAPTYSRVTLTTNNGSYYVDTTVSKNTQQTEDFTPLTSARKINVFKANERYHMFFVFAKQTTMQTYKFYVGENFDEDTFKLECVDISTEALKFSDVEGSLFYNYADNSDCRTDRGRDWATHSFDEGTGILEVVVDFRGQNDLDPTIRNGLCLPRSFCKPDPRDPSRCTSALAPDNPIRQANPDMEREADTICRKWAVKDLDCPEKGCLGFSFQMPGDFVADDSHHRPDPEPFPGRTRDDGKPGWEVEFERTRQGPDNMSGQSAIGGQCYYPRLPGSQGCPVP